MRVYACLFGFAAAFAVTSAAARPSNVAEAHCIITGATGSGSSKRSMGEAIDRAIANCIDKGGVPACCRKGARPVSVAK